MDALPDSKPERSRSPCSNRSRMASANYSRASTPYRLRLCWSNKAQLLTLTAPEMTVLVGGMRVLNANFGKSQHGVFTKRPEALTNDFFVNLLDMGTEWKAVSDAKDVFEGRDRRRAKLKWTGTRVDLIFVPTPSSGPWPRSTEARTRRQSSSRTLWRRGTR